MLSVLHLSYWDNVGGSGRAAYRVHTGLRRLGVRSRMLVAHKATDDEDVRILGGRCCGRVERLAGRAVDHLGLQYLWYPSSLALPWTRWVREANVVQLFNIHGGYYSHLGLASLARRRAVVWRLSDMWAMTGHCGYSYECERWRTGCGACPHLDEHPALSRDTSALLWRLKARVYARTPLTIVTPSRWLAGLARQSPLLRRFAIHVIPNGLDTDVFRPIDKREARRRLGLDPDRPVIFFNAGSVRLARKGGAYLSEALMRLETSGPEPTLLVAGRDGNGWRCDRGFRTVVLGHVHDDRELAVAYSAADLFVLPTLAENIANSLLESLACGTPAVSFEVGGVPEAVRHMETGYLAAYGDAADLAKGIQSLLDDSDLRSRMSHRCREVVEQEYSLGLQARRFLDLYREVISSCKSWPVPAKR